MNGIIYCFTFPNNKIYIGKTQREFNVRMRSHKYGSKHIKNYLYNAIRLYGWENIKIEILCECKTKDELNQKEIEFINKFDTTDPDKGYNLRSGGEGGLHNDSTKLKISESNKANKNGMYGKVPWNKGKKLTQEHIKNLSTSHIGQKPWNKGKELPKRGQLDEETKNKISKANSGENNGNAKLNCKIVKEIRQKYETEKFTQKELAALYQLSSERINRIVNYKVWRNCE
jgi:group I intron endonuclease